MQMMLKRGVGKSQIGADYLNQSQRRDSFYRVWAGTELGPDWTGIGRDGDRNRGRRKSQRGTGWERALAWALA